MQPKAEWAIDSEGKRNDCFSKIQLVGQKSIKTKHLSLVRLDFLPTKHYKYGWRFSLPVGYLTIIPRARMGYESIAHEAEGRMGY